MVSIQVNSIRFESKTFLVETMSVVSSLHTGFALSMLTNLMVYFPVKSTNIQNRVVFFFVGFGSL